MLRGSQNPVKCTKCHGDIDTMLAYCGERIGSYIVHHRDPMDGADRLADGNHRRIKKRRFRSPLPVLER